MWSMQCCANFSPRFIDQVLHDLPFCYAYTVDNVFIASASPDEHKKHLHLTFNCLKEYGKIINPTKCILGVFCLHFLGHLVDSQGIWPLEEKVKVMQEFPQPCSDEA